MPCSQYKGFVENDVKTQRNFRIDISIRSYTYDKANIRIEIVLVTEIDSNLSQCF